MISHFSKEENEIITCALEYWAYPCHAKQLIEALEEWKYAMEVPGSDKIDMDEGKVTGILIKKLKKKFKIKKKKKNA
jgi:hypothetical protein